ncbi:MAG: tRNA (adenosine(37)-N6)-threonylcarbamoyltransferase complex dimerization subunit type 1 TsaB [Bacteroidetes bacterium]|nr:tRNA (adenosine(37)-N6)-threonylcarbamoyltransferase complex dimerization subunit type 1 TsaB [Bacteroidota bacterium]
MAKILAIETATRACSVALIDGEEILGELSLYVPRVHVERLVIMINNLLDNLHLKHSDLDAIAVSNGPGSFTGLRIGLSVAKGIAFALNKKIIAVPTLDAIAFRLREFDDGKVVAPLLHARAEEFYYASFKFVNSKLEPLGDYLIAEAGKIADEFDQDTIFVGDGAGTFFKNEIVRRKFVSGYRKGLAASAREVALLAAEKFERGEFADLRSLVPLYIKDFVAVKGNPLNKLLEKI